MRGRRKLAMVTKNSHPVDIMISIKDAADTLIPELYMEKENGYDEWFTAKVTGSLEAMKADTTTLTDHDQAMNRVWQNILARKPKAASKRRVRTAHAVQS